MMKKIIAGSCSFVLILLFTVHAEATTISLSLEPSSISINRLESFNVDIVLSGLIDSDTISTFDIDIDFDPAVLSFNSILLGSGLGDLFAGDAQDLSLGDNGSGTVNISELSWIFPDFYTGESFFADQFTSSSDSLILATLSFAGVVQGTSALSFSNVVLGDEWGDPFYAASLNTGSVTVNAPVPEPATMILFGTGLAVLMGTGVKRKKQ